MKLLHDLYNGDREGLSVRFLDNVQQVKTVNSQIKGDRFYILLVKKGEVRLSSGTRLLELRSGDLMVMPVNVFWRIIRSISAKFGLFIISLPATFGLQNYWGENEPAFLTFLMALPFSKLALNKKERTFMLLLFEMLAVRTDKTGDKHVTGETVSILIYLLQLELSVLFHKYDRNVRSSSPRAYRYLGGFLKLLSRHYSTQHHIPFYAERLQVGPEYLSKTIKAVTGRSAKYFIKQAIIKEAMILLQGSPDIAEIGRRVGFNDPPSFSRFFKRHTSMSPSAFRQNLDSHQT
ncbi:MAG: helix-turn-helix domain-containing protein [Sediminicola sp.]